MRKRIAASQYTRPGDPLKVDCGYRPNGVIRMFQAVSLEGDLEAAKVLAFAADKLRAGVQRVEGASLRSCRDRRAAAQCRSGEWRGRGSLSLWCGDDGGAGFARADGE